MNNRIFSTIHLSWVFLTLLAALVRNSIPQPILDLAVYWALVGVLSFLMVMIRNAMEKGQAKKQEEKLIAEVKDLKSTMFDMERQHTAIEKKLADCEKRTALNGN